jgi:methionyl-tRNA formyltransferase
MLARAVRAIGPEETSVEVERALAELGAPLLVSVADQLAEGTAIEVPQDDSQATLAPKIAKTESSIDWSLPAARIHDLVRGLQPWPLVSIHIGGHRYLLHRTQKAPERSDAEPATIVAAAGDRLEVAVGGGEVLRIIQIQPEGRRVMTTREFLSGHAVAVGARLEP